MDNVFLGIDIGGQTIKGIKIAESGAVAGRLSLPTKAREGVDAVLGVLGEVIDTLSSNSRVVSIGVGTPGAVDPEGRIASVAVNIPGWAGTDIRAFIASRQPVPVFVRNDGNLAAYAEWAVRKGDSRYLLFIGLGTGIGGGYIEEGRILGGVNDRALEIGHIIVRPEGRLCACGMHGCSEAYASAPAIVKNAIELADRYDSPLAKKISRLKKAQAAGAEAAGEEEINPETVYSAFAQGDELAIAVDSLVADTLARTCATAIALLAPDRIVLGGGLLRGAGHLVHSVAELVGHYVYADALEGLSFEAALCGHEAGLWGAVLYGASAVLDRASLLELAGSAKFIELGHPRDMPSTLEL
jgi:glucokinase